MQYQQEEDLTNVPPPCFYHGDGNNNTNHDPLEIALAGIGSLGNLIGSTLREDNHDNHSISHHHVSNHQEHEPLTGSHLEEDEEEEDQSVAARTTSTLASSVASSHHNRSTASASGTATAAATNSTRKRYAVDETLMRKKANNMHTWKCGNCSASNMETLSHHCGVCGTHKLMSRGMAMAGAGTHRSGGRRSAPASLAGSRRGRPMSSIRSMASSRASRNSSMNNNRRSDYLDSSVASNNSFAMDELVHNLEGIEFDVCYDDSYFRVDEEPEPERTTAFDDGAVSAPRPDIVTVNWHESASRLSSGHWSLQDIEKWQCSTCTYENEPLYRCCEMCGTSRPQLNVAKGSAAPQQAATVAAAADVPTPVATAPALASSSKSIFSLNSMESESVRSLQEERLNEVTKYFRKWQPIDGHRAPAGVGRRSSSPTASPASNLDTAPRIRAPKETHKTARRCTSPLPPRPRTVATIPKRRSLSPPEQERASQMSLPMPPAMFASRIASSAATIPAMPPSSASRSSTASRSPRHSISPGPTRTRRSNMLASGAIASSRNNSNSPVPAHLRQSNFLAGPAAATSMNNSSSTNQMESSLRHMGSDESLQERNVFAGAAASSTSMEDSLRKIPVPNRRGGKGVWDPQDSQGTATTFGMSSSAFSFNVDEMWYPEGIDEEEEEEVTGVLESH